MQRSGLEWAHRLSREPGRLARRYLREDAPFALRLLASSAMRRDRTDPDEWEDVLTPAEREEWFGDEDRAADHVPSAAGLAVPFEPARDPWRSDDLPGARHPADGEGPRAGGGSRPRPRPRPGHNRQPDA
jgi:hypothetical protein